MIKFYGKFSVCRLYPRHRGKLGDVDEIEKDKEKIHTQS